MANRALNVDERCPHCNGALKEIGQTRGGRAVKRCLTCGREPDAIVTRPSAGSPPAASPTTSTAERKCSVDGRPGFVRGSAPCECCQRRAVWADKHMPKRSCQICGGALQGSRLLKFCKACKTISTKASVANAPSKKNRAASA